MPGQVQGQTISTDGREKLEIASKVNFASKKNLSFKKNNFPIFNNFFRKSISDII